MLSFMDSDTARLYMFESSVMCECKMRPEVLLQRSHRNAHVQHLPVVTHLLRGALRFYVNSRIFSCSSTYDLHKSQVCAAPFSQNVYWRQVGDTGCRPVALATMLLHSSVCLQYE